MQSHRATTRLAHSSRNAVKHGLSGGAFCLLQSEAPDLFAAQKAEIFASIQPRDAIEVYEPNRIAQERTLLRFHNGLIRYSSARGKNELRLPLQLTDSLAPMPLDHAPHTVRIANYEAHHPEIHVIAFSTIYRQHSAHLQTRTTHPHHSKAST